MRAISRLLQALGFILIFVGIIPIPGFPDIGIFPGIVLLFIGRIISKQTPGPQTSSGRSRPTPQRVLNTERTPRPASPAPRRRPPVRRMEPEPPSTPKPSPEPAGKQSVLESILLAGSELAGEKAEGGGAIDETEVGPGMTSEEMITGKGAGRVVGDMEVGLGMTSEGLIARKGIQDDMGIKPRMTSEEMVAEARKRWGHRPQDR